METVLQNIQMNVPKSDVRLLKALAKKMGWVIETKSDTLRNYILSRPKNIVVSEEDILSELKSVRYK
ncbi:hypothetical protein [Viscerimonas tarda]